MTTQDQKQEKDKSQRVASHLDDLLFGDEGIAHYQGLACGYISEFIKQVPIDSSLAFSICHAIEEDKLDIPEMSSRFPKPKVAFHELQNEVAQEKEPLTKHIDELKRQIKKATGKPPRAKPTEETTQLQTELDGLEKQLAEIKSPTYVARYPEAKKTDAITSKPGVVDPEDWDNLQQLFDERTKRLSSEEPNHYLKNLRVISKELGLSENEVKVLTFLTVHDEGGPLELFINDLAPHNQRQYNAMVGRMLGMDTETVSALFRPESHLMQYGLIVPPLSESYDEEGIRTSSKKRIDGLPTISDYLCDILSEPNMTPTQLKEKLTGHTIPTTDLDWKKDFGGLGEDGDRTLRLVESAIERRGKDSSKSGPTIFFHGEPDTGKTTALAALVQHLKQKDPEIEIRVIGERNGTETVFTDNGEMIPGQTRELLPQDRISQIKMALALGGKNPKTLFLVEEPNFLPREDHSDGIDDYVDRVVIQRLFENHGASALFFATNHFGEIHPAVRRRVTQAVEFNTPNREKRKEILLNLCAKHNITLDEADANRLASTYEISAGKWASAVTNAEITAKPGDSANEIEYWIQNQAKRDMGSVSAIMATHQKPKHPYDFKLLNSVDPSIPLDDLFERVKKLPPGKQKFRMCLEGWSGTGKSEFVWHLADLMGKEVIHAKASDILDKYVGGTEQNIASYFEAAQERGAILLIDEVDSILRDRKTAERGWEVSQVNQFLTSLEHYNGMLAVTTNHFNMLDTAAKRRFNFVMGFDFLTPEQNAYAFKKFFGMDAPEDYTPPRNLTPSDYAIAYEQAEFMDRLDDPKFLTQQLNASSKSKPKEDKPRYMAEEDMGFRRGLAAQRA